MDVDEWEVVGGDDGLVEMNNKMYDQSVLEMNYFNILGPEMEYCLSNRGEEEEVLSNDELVEMEMDDDSGGGGGGVWKRAICSFGVAAAAAAFFVHHILMTTHRHHPPPFHIYTTHKARRSRERQAMAIRGGEGVPMTTARITCAGYYDAPSL